MTPAQEQYFFDLATKVIAHRATHLEAQEFDALLTQSHEHRDRFEKFKADVMVAKDILELVDASEAKGAGLTASQLVRLKREVEALKGMAADEVVVESQAKGRIPVWFHVITSFTVALFLEFLLLLWLDHYRGQDVGEHLPTIKENLNFLEWRQTAAAHLNMILRWNIEPVKPSVLTSTNMLTIFIESPTNGTGPNSPEVKYQLVEFPAINTNLALRFRLLSSSTNQAFFIVHGTGANLSVTNITPYGTNGGNDYLTYNYMIDPASDRLFAVAEYQEKMFSHKVRVPRVGERFVTYQMVAAVDFLGKGDSIPSTLAAGTTRESTINVKNAYEFDVKRTFLARLLGHPASLDDLRFHDFLHADNYSTKSPSEVRAAIREKIIPIMEAIKKLPSSPVGQTSENEPDVVSISQPELTKLADWIEAVGQDEANTNHVQWATDVRPLRRSAFDIFVNY